MARQRIKRSRAFKVYRGGIFARYTSWEDGERMVCERQACRVVDAEGKHVGYDVGRSESVKLAPVLVRSHPSVTAREMQRYAQRHLPDAGSPQFLEALVAKVNAHAPRGVPAV